MRPIGLSWSRKSSGPCSIGVMAPERISSVTPGMSSVTVSYGTARAVIVHPSVPVAGGVVAAISVDLVSLPVGCMIIARRFRGSGIIAVASFPFCFLFFL